MAIRSNITAQLVESLTPNYAEFTILHQVAYYSVKHFELLLLNTIMDLLELERLPDHIYVVSNLEIRFPVRTGMSLLQR